jgi:hypothetical protein
MNILIRNCFYKLLWMCENECLSWQRKHASAYVEECREMVSYAITHNVLDLMDCMDSISIRMHSSENK